MKHLLTLAALLLVSSELFAQTPTIRGVRLTGSGCSESDASASVTPDGTYLSVLFDNFKAEIGNGSSNPQAQALKKQCTVLIDMDVPFGYQYALETTEFRGFAALPASAYGYHRFTQLVPNGVPNMRETQLRGPIGDNYEAIVRQKPGRSPWSVCNSPQQTVQILAELSVAYLPRTTDRSMAQINLDSVDTGVQSRFKMTWRPCR
jgi:hypothetical protein